MSLYTKGWIVLVLGLCTFYSGVFVFEGVLQAILVTAGIGLIASTKFLFTQDTMDQHKKYKDRI